MWHDRITTKEREGEGSVVAPALCPRGVKKLEYEFHFVKFLLIFGRCSRHRQEAFGMEGGGRGRGTRTNRRMVLSSRQTVLGI